MEIIDQLVRQNKEVIASNNRIYAAIERLIVLMSQKDNERVNTKEALTLLGRKNPRVLKTIRNKWMENTEWGFDGKEAWYKTSKIQELKSRHDKGEIILPKA